MEEDKNKIQLLDKKYNSEIYEETSTCVKCDTCDNNAFTSITVCGSNESTAYLCRNCLRKK